MAAVGFIGLVMGSPILRNLKAGHKVVAYSIIPLGAGCKPLALTAALRMHAPVGRSFNFPPQARTAPSP